MFWSGLFFSRAGTFLNGPASNPGVVAMVMMTNNSWTMNTEKKQQLEPTQTATKNTGLDTHLPQGLVLFTDIVVTHRDGIS